MKEGPSDQGADTAASVVSTGALVACVALVVGAIAAWFGGRAGVVRPADAGRVVTSHRIKVILRHGAAWPVNRPDRSPAAPA